MLQLVYVSAATRDLSDTDLLELLAQSRERNEKFHITGLLLFANGNFIQLLEGEEKDVDELYQSILNDDRNEKNLVVWRRNTEERAFPDWEMGFRLVSDQHSSAIDGYTNFLDRDIDSRAPENSDESIMELFDFFRQENR